MADGARSEKSLARTLFLVFGGKTIGRSPLPKYPSYNLILLLASLPYLFIRPTKNSKEFAPFYISCCSQCYALLCFVLFQRLIDATYVCGRSELLISIEIGIMP